MSSALNPLVQKVRAAHPGAYDDLDDAALTKRVLAKYPQYSDLAAPAMKPFRLDMEEPSTGERFATSVARGAGVVSNEEGKNFFLHPIDTAKSMLEGQGELGKKAFDSAKSGDWKGAVVHGLDFLNPINGQQLDKAAEQLNSGDIAGGAGTTVGAALPILASKIGPSGSVAENGKLGTFELPQEETPSNAGAKAKAVGTVAAKHLASKVPGVGLLVRRPSLQDWWEAAKTKAPQPPPVEKPPAPEEFSLPSDPPPTPPSKTAVSKTLDSTLRDAVGAPPSPRPGIPMKEQFNLDAKPQARTVQEGHTAVDSSAVDSFKYDAQAKELHVATPDGTTYIYGDAAPDAAQALANAPSKGKAWKAIRDNHPLVGKIVNGKRIAVKPSGPRTFGPDGEIGPDEDLVNALKKNLSQPKTVSQKASAVPQTSQDMVDALQRSIEAVQEHGKARGAALKDSLKEFGTDSEPTRRQYKTLHNGSIYEYSGGQFLKDGQVLDKGGDIADAIDILEGKGKTIEGAIARPKLPPQRQ